MNSKYNNYKRQEEGLVDVEANEATTTLIETTKV